MKRLVIVLVSAGVLALAGLAGAATDSLVVVETAELRAQPVDGAALRGRIEKGTAARRLERTGGWIRVAVDDDGPAGWLRLWQVRETGDGDGNPLLRGLQRFSRNITGLFRGRGDADARKTEITATIGVRGLDAGDFEEATPAPGALQGVRRLRGDREAAATFARSAGLQRREVTTPESQPSQDWGDW